MNTYAQQLEQVAFEAERNLSIIVDCIGEKTPSNHNHKVVCLSDLEDEVDVECGSFLITDIYTSGFIDEHGNTYSFEITSSDKICLLVDFAINYWLKQIAYESVELVKSWGKDFDIQSFNHSAHANELVSKMAANLIGDFNIDEMAVVVSEKIKAGLSD
jgi:hypothetical protein